MKKYLVITKMGWDKTLKYRVNFFMGQLRGLIIVFSLYFLYTNIIGENNAMFGFDRTLIITYVLLSNILFSFIFQYSMNAIADSISSGQINAVLLKPVNFFYFYFFRFLSERFINLLFSIISVVLFLLVIKPQVFIQTDIGNNIVFFIATILATILFSIIETTIGLSAFWMVNAYSPRFLFKVIIEITSGRYFPLQMMPNLFRTVINILPIGYIMFFPINVYFGLTDTFQIIKSFIMTISWIVASILLFKVVWAKGTKVHGAYGG